MPDCYTAGSVSLFLRLVRRLQREWRVREERQEFFIEGVRNLVHGVEAGVEVRAVVCSSRLLSSSLARLIIEQLQAAGVPVVSVSPEQFRQISQAPRASGVGAIVAQQWTTLEQISPEKDQPWIVLGKLNSPGNLGTMIRSSECLGGAGFILLDKAVDPFEPATVRASMGAIYRQRFIRTRLKFLRRWMDRTHVLAVGASPDGTVMLPASPLSRAKLILLGEERGGLTEEQRAVCSELVSIPMTGRSDSLNVSIACSLFLYERLRQSLP